VSARRLLSGGVALLLAGTVVAMPATAHAAAEAPPAQITTASTRVVSWEPRTAADGPPHPEVYDKLKDWKLRVSQTKDLLNQTIEVSWSGGGTTGNGTFLQLMQCWSDGPNDPPTREQCAYGGVDREGAEGAGSARTRAVSAFDPRERTYRISGDMFAVQVKGAAPPPTWPESAQVVMGSGNASAACPPGTTGYTVFVVPPAGGTKLKVEGPTSSPPGSLTVQVGSSSRTYPVVTGAFSMAELADQAGVHWTNGDYRVELACDVDGDTSPPSRFVGFLQRLTTPTGSVVWRRSDHEGTVFVPFDPVGDTPDLAPTDPFERNQILDYVQPRTSNEIWVAKNHADGTGDVPMEVLTDLEAQHLGCGRKEASGTRMCWLVAVPRWVSEPNGSDYVGNVATSPLSETNWDRRIAVPLEFAPVAAGCTIGSGLKQLLSHDSALSALRSWQPTFCGDSTTASSVLGPLQDDAVRSGISSPNRMGVVTIPPQGLSTLVTAPIATSGVVVGFSADRKVPYGSENYGLDGTATTLMNLNARLLAKLLTQSYDSGAAPNGGKTSGYNSSVRSGDVQPTYYPARSFPKDNPRRLYDDPEFLALNPDFALWLKEGADLVSPADMADVLVSANDADAYNVLWRWILGDKDAKAFLEGTPDPHGMRVNPYYKGRITHDLSSFPELDPTCVDDIEDPAAGEFPLLCQINNHPRVDDDSDAAQAAVRGDTKRVNVAPTVFDSSTTAFKVEGRQQQGGHGMLVITSSAVAARYGLPTARLRNASGAFVAATASSLAAARSRMAKRSDGVLLPDPAHVTGDGYPLTTMSYAIADVAALTPAQDEAFATILDYVAGAGQVPGTAIGQLPPGYAPLSTSLKAQTAKAADVLRDPSALLGPPEGPVPTPEPGAPPLPPVVAPGAVVVPNVVQPGTNGTPIALPPAVAATSSLTGRATAALPWAVPALLLVAASGLVASRLLRHLGGKASS
jgi:hypothetical protein